MTGSKLSIPLPHFLIGELGVIWYHIRNAMAMVFMKHLGLCYIHM